VDAVKFVPPEHLRDQFNRVGRSSVVTCGEFRYPAACEQGDLDWNHMDQHHRPCIHRTYAQAVRLASGRDFALSLTTVAGLPAMVQVTDVRLGDGLFYQGFTLFGLLYVHCVIKNPMPGDDPVIRVNWYIVSHRLFAFVHPLVDRRLRRLNEVQNREDDPIRVRRADLRRKGFTFISDRPDFLSSNTLTPSVVPPRIPRPFRFSLEAVRGDLPAVLSEGPVEILVRRVSRDRISVWPGVCPHQGGPLGEGSHTSDVVECPWHGLKFKALSLSAAQPRGMVGSWEVLLEGEELVVQPAS
jgi:nitrite reductase/ring-hydroxylating ferredoxin subunit